MRGMDLFVTSGAEEVARSKAEELEVYAAISCHWAVFRRF